MIFKLSTILINEQYLVIYHKFNHRVIWCTQCHNTPNKLNKINLHFCMQVKTKKTILVAVMIKYNSISNEIMFSFHLSHDVLSLFTFVRLVNSTEKL